MTGLYHRLIHWLDRFLFESCDAAMASCLRIGYAILLLIYIAVWMPDAEMWFSDSGVVRSETIQSTGTYPQWSLLFYLPESLGSPQRVLAVLATHAVLLLFGCYSRVQAACIFLWLTSLQHRNPIICDGEDTVFRLLAFFMIFLPLDHVFTVRRYGQNLRRWRDLSVGDRSSAWAMRLVQLQVTALYASTAWSKWQGETWRDGTALYYVSMMGDVFGRFWLPEGLFAMPLALRLGTWAVLLLESALPVMLWIPKLRKLAICLGLLLHLAIEYSMHLFLFEWIMMLCLLSFVRRTDLKIGGYGVSA